MIISIEKPGTPAELVHAGIKGMKWGVRKKREVSPERKAKREAKAQKFVKKASAAQTKIDAIKAQPHQKFKENPARWLLYDKTAAIANLERTKAQALKDAESKRQGKLSRRQKQVIIGGAVVGLLVAGGVLAVTMNSGQARQVMNKGRAFVTRKEFAFKKNDAFKDSTLSADDIHKKVVDGINPGFPKGLGTQMNCRRATFAYEMRRRGHDVQATRTPNGNGQTSGGLLNAIDTKGKDISTRNVIKRLGKDDVTDPTTRHLKAFGKRNGSLRDFKHPQFLFSDLAKSQPERSRGEITLHWAGGGGHSMAYEIIGGKTHLFDTQSGKHYSSFNEIYNDIGAVKAAGFTRLDNMELDKNFLERWVK